MMKMAVCTDYYHSAIAVASAYCLVLTTFAVNQPTSLLSSAIGFVLMN